MNKETVNLIIAQIDKLALKLGVVSGKILPILIHQVQVEAVMSLLLAGILVFSLSCFYMTAKAKWKVIDSYGTEGIVVIIGLILAIMTIFSLFIGFLNLNKLINPTYYALERIINLIH